MPAGDDVGEGDSASTFRGQYMRSSRKSGAATGYYPTSITLTAGTARGTLTTTHNTTNGTITGTYTPGT